MKKAIIYSDIKGGKNILVIFIKVAIMVLIGSYSNDEYSVPIKACSILIVSYIFYSTLKENGYFDFLVQLFLCDHFPIGLTLGGTFNVAASIALLFNYFILNKRISNNRSSLSLSSKYILGILFFIQTISVLAGNEFMLYKKVLAILVFLMILFLFYYSSKLEITELNFYRLINITGIFLIYMFVVSVNQKYEFFYSPFAIFPSLDKKVEYDMGILRSAGPMINFEAYAEYSLLIIAILLPGILSGSFKIMKTSFHYFCMFIVLIAVLSIVLSGTRSCILLLPLLIVIVIVGLGKNLKLEILFSIVIFFIVFFVINTSYKLIDLNVFSERSSKVDFANLDFSKILSGEEINRGDIFSYGIKKINRGIGVFGAGYFSTRYEYTYVQFDDSSYLFGDIPDYHNLYMAIIVMWGVLGCPLFVFLFISTISRGMVLYRSIQLSNSFLSNLLFGFSLAFIFLLINQFKIQFIREPSYFVLVLIILAINNSLIKYISTRQYT